MIITDLHVIFHLLYTRNTLQVCGRHPFGGPAGTKDRIGT